MVKKTRIALISDLHIGAEAISVDLCPHPIDPSKEVGMEKNFLKKLLDFIGSSNFLNAGPIDFLCVTGDISDRADPLEFRLADQIIRKIADALNISLDSVFFVPGNHDVHWPVMQLEPALFWSKYRYEPLLQKELLFKERLLAAHEGSIHETPHYVIWKNERYIVVGINSAADDDPKPADGKNHGLIYQKTIDELDSVLGSIPYNPNQFRLCLLHHHPINYSDAMPEFADFSMATNSGNLFTLLSNHNFDLLFHGHKHVPQLNHIPANNNGHPMTVLGAGSLSAQISTEWSGLAQNQFHIVELAGRNPKTHAAFGNVGTWNFVGRKWCEGESRLGLCAIEGFGALSTAIELEQEIRSKLNDLFKDGASYCKWSKLKKIMPDLAYVNTKAAFSAISRVVATDGYKFMGDLYSKSQDWIILREDTDHG